MGRFRRVHQATVLGVVFALEACAAQLPVVPGPDQVFSTVAVGRVVAVLTGQRRRLYEPAVRSFEIQHRQTHERITVEIESDDQRFILPLSPGEYDLIRVQISEGPFLSIAQLNSTFVVRPDAITYVGLWRFGVDSPKYGRMISVSMVGDDADRADASEVMKQDYPSLSIESVAIALPDPAEERTRLYEVMPYPRYSRYFRRHWW